MTDESGKKDEVQLLKDVVVPKKFYERLTLGVVELNEIFGGQEMPGILPGSTFLLTGVPGAGKSTMALQMADLLQKHAGRSILYNICEENINMVKIRADRLGLAGNISVSCITEVDDLIAYCRRTGVEVLFQDSLQTLCEDGETGFAQVKSIAQKLQDFSKSDDVTLFIIGHVTKGGTFAGPNQVKHSFDAHAHLKLNVDTGGRLFELQKNRNGPAMIPYEFMMNSSGMDFKHIVEAEMSSGGQGEQGSKAADRRDKIEKLIIEKLEAGEKVSGYCYERFEVDCSGGFWRGMLSKACQKLQREGKKVVEQKINNRLHYSLEK